MKPCPATGSIESERHETLRPACPVGRVERPIEPRAVEPQREVLEHLDFGIGEFRKMEMQPSLQRALCPAYGGQTQRTAEGVGLPIIAKPAGPWQTVRGGDILEVYALYGENLPTQIAELVLSSSSLRTLQSLNDQPKGRDAPRKDRRNLALWHKVSEGRQSPQATRLGERRLCRPTRLGEGCYMR